MQDNALIALLIATIRDGLTAQGRAGIAVKQAYQPTQQGADSGPTVYVHKVMDKRRGSPGKSARWDAGTLAMIQTETEVLETSYQVQALARQNPADTTAPTAADLLRMVSNVLQSDYALSRLRAADVGMLSIPSLTNTPTLNDKQVWEYAPLLEFTVTHQDVTVWTIPAATGIEFGIYRV